MEVCVLPGHIAASLHTRACVDGVTARVPEDAESAGSLPNGMKCALLGWGAVSRGEATSAQTGRRGFLT